MRRVTYIGKLMLLLVACCACQGENLENNGLRPYPKNPRYWQYEGKPVMLLGGNKWDAPFFVRDQESVYDDLQAAGGNYLRYILNRYSARLARFS